MAPEPSVYAGCSPAGPPASRQPALWLGWGPMAN